MGGHPEEVASLSAALLWVEQRWDEQRSAPIRLHLSNDTEGALGGLPFSPAMIRMLDAKPSDTYGASFTVNCYHPTLTSQSVRDCPECDGTGVKEQRAERYRYPMWRAIVKLQNALRPRRQPHPYALVLALAAHGWDARAAASSLELGWDTAEALFLRAIRQLNGRYEEGPLDTRRSVIRAGGWIALSESQQNAIQAGETAA